MMDPWEAAGRFMKRNTPNRQFGGHDGAPSSGAIKGKLSEAPYGDGTKQPEPEYPDPAATKENLLPDNRPVNNVQFNRLAEALQKEFELPQVNPDTVRQQEQASGEAQGPNPNPASYGETPEEAKVRSTQLKNLLSQGLQGFGGEYPKNLKGFLNTLIVRDPGLRELLDSNPRIHGDPLELEARAVMNGYLMDNPDSPAWEALNELVYGKNVKKARVPVWHIDPDTGDMRKIVDLDDYDADLGVTKTIDPEAVRAQEQDPSSQLPFEGAQPNETNEETLARANDNENVYGWARRRLSDIHRPPHTFLSEPGATSINVKGGEPVPLDQSDLLQAMVSSDPEFQSYVDKTKLDEKPLYRYKGAILDWLNRHPDSPAWEPVRFYGGTHVSKSWEDKQIKEQQKLTERIKEAFRQYGMEDAADPAAFIRKRPQKHKDKDTASVTIATDSFPTQTATAKTVSGKIEGRYDVPRALDEAPDEDELARDRADLLEAYAALLREHML